ncbi:MAG: CarD family transcriptional regulator [Bacillota bacterium]|nr:MAG: CarD family transcriptional regulator [Bacillota bacterium]
MFQVGDRVVYPMHGAGIIEAIEEREVLGARQTYYVMRLPLGDLQVMIPTEAASSAGLRQVVPPETLHQVFEILRSHRAKVQANWNRRYRTHLEKMRSGDILEVAEVVKNLTDREREKGLSGGERKMLESARQILLSEIILALGLAPEEAVDLVDSALAM